MFLCRFKLSKLVRPWPYQPYRFLQLNLTCTVCGSNTLSNCEENAFAKMLDTIGPIVHQCCRILLPFLDCQNIPVQKVAIDPAMVGIPANMTTLYIILAHLY